MADQKAPVALRALEAPPRSKNSAYPAQFAAVVKGREKRALGDIFALSNFGVNLTRLAPGAASALRHAHEKQDEFVYILEGTPTLYTNAGATSLEPGMCAGFRHGSKDAHRLVNESECDVLYLEIGDRTPNDSACYPDDDIAVRQVDGKWVFSRKDGAPFPS